MTRLYGPTTILVTVTPLLAGYGSSRWSWVGGPVASLALWALEHARREPDPAATQAAEARPAAVVEPATADR
jgi:hypothetical protein